MIGQCKGDLYILSPPHEIHFSIKFTNTTEEVWHQRLGHPHMSIVSCLKSKGLIKSIGTNKMTTLCESYQLGKLSKFPFLNLNVLVLSCLKKSIAIYGV